MRFLLGIVATIALWNTVDASNWFVLLNSQRFIEMLKICNSNADNCLRGLQNHPTLASPFCGTYTAAG
jgi:hypothetical protein